MICDLQDSQPVLGGALQKRIPQLVFNMGDDGEVWPSLELWQLIRASMRRGKEHKGKIKSTSSSYTLHKVVLTGVDREVM